MVLEHKSVYMAGLFGKVVLRAARARSLVFGHLLGLPRLIPMFGPCACRPPVVHDLQPSFFLCLCELDLLLVIVFLV